MFGVLIVLREGSVDGQPTFVKVNGGDKDGKCQFGTVKEALKVKEWYEKYFIGKGRQRGEYFVFVTTHFPIPQDALPPTE